MQGGGFQGEKGGAGREAGAARGGSERGVGRRGGSGFGRGAEKARAGDSRGAGPASRPRTHHRSLQGAAQGTWGPGRAPAPEEAEVRRRPEVRRDPEVRDLRK